MRVFQDPDAVVIYALPVEAEIRNVVAFGDFVAR